MSKVMETTKLADLLARIAGEYRAKGSIYEIPEKAFRRAFELEATSPGLDIMKGRASLPVGPAAGPHSQCAPNLVAAYLAGGRFFELKTVQENDSLEVAKPCIDALDEGHNTEWSTELSLVAAREEYLRGWAAINMLASIFSASPHSFLFNMSVGYTLAGIKSAGMDAFIEGMRAPAGTKFWTSALRDLEAFVESETFLSSFGSEGLTKARSLVADFPSAPIHSVTLSTMHGCPPEEIERIGSYLLEDKGMDCFVKLNPTLLGFDAARAMLDETGWKSIEIRRDNFERDLQFPDALSLIASLDAKAKACGRKFGIKLSNTLANVNSSSFLPGDERYMSGRALFPLTIRLASKLAAALPHWGSRFSYCGGAWAANAGEIVAAGLGPLTIATDILKPGGYLRLLPAARAAVAALPNSPDRPDPAALARLADSALARPEYRAGWKAGNANIAKSLPLFDCFAAPCVEACPVGQKVPEYIRLKAEGGSAEALASILADNPLPFITGTLCDHVCQEACCRNDYEGSVEIRAVKLACAKAASIPTKTVSNAASIKGRVAVIGAGPAGLACAHHLALAGVQVTVFDEALEPGGVPANVIPRFRIARTDIAADIDRIRSLGAEFRFGARLETLAPLEAEGFTAFFVCTGAPVSKKLQIKGDAMPVVDALSFLKAGSRLASGEAASWPYGEARNIVVAGGGNTAMDTARVALRLPGIEVVRLSYRRSKEDMPADEEELRNALEEGAKLMELSLPESSYLGPDGSRLSLRMMERGALDASGRSSPRATQRTESVECELLVAAIGEAPDSNLFEGLGIPCDPSGLPLCDPATQATSRAGLYVGGDAAHGPASIISAVADGRRAAYAILRAAGIEPPAANYIPSAPDADKLAARGEFAQSAPRASASFVSREAERCLRCDSACLRCVEVCPNRANFALPVSRDDSRGDDSRGDDSRGDDSRGGGFSQSIQILHIDALCNECGNCGVFCPFEGEPNRGKATLFQDRASMEAARNAGISFVTSGDEATADGKAIRSRLGARPNLLKRGVVGMEIETLIFTDWAEPGAVGPMETLARAVLREHFYLLGGGR